MSGGRLAGIAAVSVTSLLWGTTGTAATFAAGAGPLAIGAAALGIGGILQAVGAVPALRRDSQALRQHAHAVLVGALAVAIYPLAFYTSMHTAGVAIGSVVSLASAPLASGLLERVIDGSRLGRWWTLAAALGVLGSVLLCLSKFTGPAESPRVTMLGMLLGLVAGATYAIYSWASHRLIAAGVSRGASMGSVFGLGGALLMPVLLLTGAPLLASGQNTAVAAYMALIPMFLGYLLFGYGLTKISASTATTVTLTEPAIATVLAVLVVGEHLAAAGWVGMALIGLALLVLAIAPGTPELRQSAVVDHRPGRTDLAVVPAGER